MSIKRLKAEDIANTVANCKKLEHLKLGKLQTDPW